MNKFRGLWYWLAVGAVIQIIVFHSVNIFTTLLWWHVVLWPWYLLVVFFWWMVTIVAIIALILWALTAFNPKVGTALKYVWTKIIHHLGF